MELGNLIWGNSRGAYPVPREEWQKVFGQFFEDLGFDGYGYPPANLKHFETKMGGFENHVFIINPYYWGDDEDEKSKPNFVFKPTGYEIQWYKYPLRDSYANQDISFEEFVEILEQCKNSI